MTVFVAPRIYGSTPAAADAGVSRATFYRWIAEGHIPAVCLLRLPGHTLKIRRSPFLRWLDGELEGDGEAGAYDGA